LRLEFTNVIRARAQSQKSQPRQSALSIQAPDAASHGASGATDISFTLDKPDLLKARKVLDSIKGEAGFKEVIADENIGKLSIVGVGMRSHTGVAAKMFESLANAGVNIDMISTSEIKLSVVIDLAKGEHAMKTVHAAFLG